MSMYEDDYFEEDMVNAAEMAGHQPQDDDTVEYVTGDKAPSPQSLIIAIEGIDGAGKNTLTKSLAKKLGARVVSFPAYESSIFAQYAHDALHGRMGDMAESANGMALLFALDRAAEIGQLTVPGVILVDRYVGSNAAYTAARTGNESDVEWVHNLEFGNLGLPKPDIQVLIDTPPSVAAGRVNSRADSHDDRPADSYESDIGLQYRVAAEYRKLAERDWVSPWIVFHGGGTAQDVLDSMVGILGHRLDLLGGSDA